MSSIHSHRVSRLLVAIGVSALLITALLVEPAGAATRQTARLSLSDHLVRMGDRVVATASFSPARKGRRVVLQQLNADGWRTVKTGAQSRAGKARFAVYAGSGSRRYRAVTLAKGTLPTRKTRTTKLRALPPGTVRASVAGYYGAVHPDISADGRFVVYTEDRTDEGDIEPAVVLWDRSTGVRRIVDHAWSGTARVSANGRVVAWTRQNGGVFEAWTWDRLTGRKTVAPGSGYTYGDADYLKTYFPALSGDGRYVAYGEQHVLDDRAVQERIVLWDRTTGTTREVFRDDLDWYSSLPPTSEPRISADGRFVAVDRLDVDAEDGVKDPVLWSAATGSPVPLPSDVHWIEDLSEDGRYLAYGTGPNQTPSLLDRDLDRSVRIALGGRYHDWTTFAITALAADARYAVVTATPGPPGASSRTSVFVVDRRTGTTARASLAWRGAAPNAASRYGVISGNGRFVAFESKATNLVPYADDKWHEPDVFLRDRG